MTFTETSEHANVVLKTYFYCDTSERCYFEAVTSKKHLTFCPLTVLLKLHEVHDAQCEVESTVYINVVSLDCNFFSACDFLNLD